MDYCSEDAELSSYRFLFFIGGGGGAGRGGGVYVCMLDIKST